jgi:hypothetical protein
MFPRLTHGSRCSREEPDEAACGASTAFVSGRGVDAGKGIPHGNAIGHTRRGGADGRRLHPGLAISDRGKANYDAVNERLTKNQRAPLARWQRRGRTKGARQAGPPSSNAVRPSYAAAGTRSL